MAKWGEGDPRWIVEQRVDGTNVNNWHWTERDVSSWSSVLLRDLLLGVRAEGPEGVVQLTEVPKVEGESSINNRRGKLFFFYEWQLRASWLGTTGGGVKFRGTVDVSNLSDENDMEDLDISVSLCKDQPDTPLLGLMKTRGVQEVRRALGEFVRQLKSEFSQGMILAKADGQPQLPEPQTQKNQIQTCKAQVPNRKIEMRWRFRTWPGEHYAAVRLDLEDRGGETELRMECGGVPEGEEDSTREGWTRFYFQAIKQVFGY
ncbi:activator of 90 kDa heat shock protein ATPase homolog 1-like isoform X5 [Pseudoliparis swirei]|uniref:activator of 90 kDa heat shock protein ATPase homolog 1-like isoform X5 n=1 Tax=Pseudoliparis swirei TaxID=2059687 RepID=UPI0024BDFCE2|nr:activator of 90 kDa heat shock protein ATPase homolog 1-like isoform X5 [Pseudoliparis swirei]